MVPTVTSEEKNSPDAAVAEAALPAGRESRHPQQLVGRRVHVGLGLGTEQRRQRRQAHRLQDLLRLGMLQQLVDFLGARLERGLLRLGELRGLEQRLVMLLLHPALRDARGPPAPCAANLRKSANWCDNSRVSAESVRPPSSTSPAMPIWAAHAFDDGRVDQVRHQPRHARRDRARAAGLEAQRLAPPRPARPTEAARRSRSRSAPWKTGVLASNPRIRAAHPRWVSRICPTFIRDGTPSGLRTMSTGRPSGRNGMSSSGTIRAMMPLLPWRPAILSPTEIFRFSASRPSPAGSRPAGARPAGESCRSDLRTSPRPWPRSEPAASSTRADRLVDRLARPPAAS